MDRGMEEKEILWCKSRNDEQYNIHMFSKVEELMFCQEPWQMLLLLENVRLGFQIFLWKDKIIL